MEIVNEYKKYLLEADKSNNTINAYVTDINLFIKFLDSRGIELLKTDTINVMAYIQYLLVQGKSERSINRIIISLRSFYTFLKSNNYIDDMPKISYKSIKSSKKIPEILTIDEVDKIINSVETDNPKGIRDRAILELMYATGMKVSELINLICSDVNLDLSFVKCTDNKSYERLIPIGRSACSAIENYLEIRGNIALSKVDNLFVNLNGNKLTRQGIWRIVKEYSEKAEIKKDVNLNTFRHSFAVHMLQNGANVRAVQKMLGNQVLTYMDTYYEIINSDKINFIYRNTHPRA